MIFRQLMDSQTWTYTYLIADSETREAVLIDTVFEQHQRDIAMLRELDLTLRYTLDTHVHADHVTGASLMRDRMGSQVAVGAATGAKGADVYLKTGDTLTVGAHTLEVRATPGHTAGCITAVLADHTMAFTGDALLIRGAGRTDFQEGDPDELFASVREQIFTLPDACALYPGHDYSGRTVTTVAEERAHNPRLGDGVRKQDFIGYMNNLGLPHPQRLAVAMPANLQCGRPEDGGDAQRLPSWGPVIRTFAGVLEIEPDWVHTHRDSLHLVDVREQGEVDASPMGKIAGSQVIPLSALRERLAEIPDAKPLVTVCPAGARSAHAALILEKAGRSQVANLTGGLMRWRSLGFPLTGTGGA